MNTNDFKIVEREANEMISTVEKPRDKANKKYSKEERKEVKKAYEEYYENFLKLEEDKEEAARLARLSLS